MWKLVTLLFVAGCGFQWHFGETYTVRISPRFDAAQTEAALAAVSDWHTRAGVELTAVVSDCPDYSHDLCVEPGTASGAVSGGRAGSTAYGEWGGGKSTIYLDLIQKAAPGNATQLTAQTIAHELGHALMGPDHLAPGSLMAAIVEQQAHGVTGTDLAHFHAVRAR